MWVVNIPSRKWESLECVIEEEEEDNHQGQHLFERDLGHHCLFPSLKIECIVRILFYYYIDVLTAWVSDLESSLNKFKGAGQRL